jgi:hypothetical protein
MEFDPLAAVDAALTAKSDEERAKEKEEQINARTRMNVPSVAEAKVIQGEMIEQVAHENLAINPTDDAYNQLAYGMFLQGKLEQAIATVKDEYKKRHYLQVLNAVNGSACCNCASLHPKQSTQFLSNQLWVRGKIVNLHTCIVCGLIQCLES